jgi:hypothetical protein
MSAQLLTRAHMCVCVCVCVCVYTRGRDVADHVGAVRVLVTFYMSVCVCVCVCVCEREREREREEYASTQENTDRVASARVDSVTPRTPRKKIPTP